MSSEDEDLFAWGCRKGESVWHCVTMDHDPCYRENPGDPYLYPKTAKPWCGARDLVDADGDQIDWSAHPKISKNGAVRCEACEEKRVDRWRCWLDAPLKNETES